MRIRWSRRSTSGEQLEVWASDAESALSPGIRSLLRDTRKRSGYSIEELAEALGVEPDELVHLERGEFRRGVSERQIELMVARYAACLGLDPDAFLGDNDSWEDPSEVRRWSGEDPFAGSASPRHG